MYVLNYIYLQSALESPQGVYNSTNGCKYFAILIDIKENYTYYELNNNETGFPSKFIRNALEYFLSYGIIFDLGTVDSRFITDGMKSVMRVFYSQQLRVATRGIKIQVASPPGNEHHQLGAAERKAQTITRRCTALILRAQQDSSFKAHGWGHAMAHASDMINLTPTKRDGYMTTPFQRVTGEEVDLHKLALLPFWENCIVTQDRLGNSNEIGTKLTPGGINVKYIGYKVGGKQVGIFYNPLTKKTMLRRSITPIEDQTMEERLVYPLQDEEDQDEAIEQSDIISDKEIC